MVQTQRTKGFRDSSAPVRFSALSAAPPCAAQDADNSGSISKLELVAAMQSGMMSAMTKWSGLVVGFGSFVIEDPFQGIPFLCIGGLSASLVLSLYSCLANLRQITLRWTSSSCRASTAAGCAKSSGMRGVGGSWGLRCCRKDLGERIGCGQRMQKGLQN